MRCDLVGHHRYFCVRPIVSSKLNDHEKFPPSPAFFFFCILSLPSFLIFFSPCRVHLFHIGFPSPWIRWRHFVFLEMHEVLFGGTWGVKRDNQNVRNFFFLSENEFSAKSDNLFTNIDISTMVFMSTSLFWQNKSEVMNLSYHNRLSLGVYMSKYFFLSKNGFSRKGQNGLYI